MANYTQLIKTINDNIKANGNQEITGPVLNAVLQAIVSGLSEGALFVGIANTTTNPPAYDGDVFYIALEPGTYSNFGVIVPNGSIGIIYNTSSDWAVTLINTYYEIDVDTLMQDSPSSEDINEAIGSFTYLKRAITVGVPFFGKGASGGDSTVAIAQVKQLSDTEVRVVMLNTGTVDGSNEPVPIIKKITNSAGQLSLSTEAPTSFVGPLSSLNTNEKGSVVEAINEINTRLKSTVKPYVVDLTGLLTAQDSESISTAIGGIDNLNGTVQKNQVIFGTLANGTVAVGIRVLGNQTTLTYFVDSLVGLTVNEVIITNTDGTLSKTVNTHAVLTENMVIDSLESDETTLPLSAAQGKVLSEEVETNTSDVTRIDKAIGNPTEEEHNLTVAESGKFWSVNGQKNSNTSFNLSNIISLKKGDLLRTRLSDSSVNVSLITKVSSNGDFVESVVPAIGVGGVRTWFYLADNDCYVQISYSAGSSYKYTIIKSPFNTVVSDNSYTQYLHKVYESYGAVYNKSTGYWEYGDLKDMTEEDCFLAALYALDLVSITVDNTPKGGVTIRRPIYIRTIFTKAKSTNSLYNSIYYSIDAIFAQSSFEYIAFSQSNTDELLVKRSINAFKSCKKLKTIDTVMRFTADSVVNNIFLDCLALANVKLKALKIDISLSESPLISYESLNYLVTNAANTSAITVTVHPTTYSYLTGITPPTAEVGGTAEEWQALVTTAQGKQISFAVPEETQSEVTE